MTMERLTTGDFIARLPFRSGGGRDRGGPWRRAWFRVRARLGWVPAAADWQMLLARRAAAPPAFAACRKLRVWPSCTRFAAPRGCQAPALGLWGQKRPYRGGARAREFPPAKAPM